MWRVVQKILWSMFFLGVAGVGGCIVLVQAQGGKLLSVQTGSMTPHINKGDLVVVTRVPNSGLVVGDVVTYMSPRARQVTITHRVIAIRGGQVITKGDANPIADQPISRRAIIGRVSRHVPYAGRALDFMRRPIGLALLIYVPALSIILTEIRRLSEYYRRQQPYFAPGVEVRLRSHLHARSAHKTPAAAKLSATVVMLALAGLIGHAYATLGSTAALTGNTINAVRPRVCTDHSGSTVTVVTTHTSQTAVSGDATASGQITNGSAHSGDASNANTTNVTITIDNCHKTTGVR